MSYHTYQTEGIILGKRDVGEADRIFGILTKDLGRLDAIAQGIRYLKSKLRYNLDLFSYSRLGLVMSRDSWRIIDAEELNGRTNIRKVPEKLAVASRIAGLINRMVRGQEADAVLWEEVKKALILLENLKAGKNLEVFELLTSLKILCRLGYVAQRERWFRMSFEEAELEKPLILSTIKKALEESQL